MIGVRNKRTYIKQHKGKIVYCPQTNKFIGFYGARILFNGDEIEVIDKLFNYIKK